MLTSVDKLAIILLSSDSGIANTLERDDGHPLRAALRVVDEKDLLERPDCLAKKFLLETRVWKSEPIKKGDFPRPRVRQRRGGDG